MTIVDASTRSHFVTQTLALRHIPDAGLAFDQELDAAWIDREICAPEASALEYRAPRAGHVHLELVPLGRIESMPPIRIRGTIDVTLESDCVRCLSSTELPCKVPIDVTLFPAARESEGKARAGARNAGEPAGDLETSDDDATYDPEAIDLPSIVREAILLDLDMNPTCADELACSTRTRELIERANGPASAASTEFGPSVGAIRRKS